MSADTVCRVCLVTNLNLYGVRNELQNIYDIITGLKYNKVGYPQSMCYMCLSALRKCQRFMETARDADRLLTQWYKHQNELGVVKPLSTYSITEATLLSVGNAHISLKHDFKTENIDVAEQLVVDVQTENTECNDNMDTENSEVDEPTDCITMLVDTSTVTTYNDTTQVSDDKQTVSLFSTNMDMVSQHYNDDSQICQITEVKSESETSEAIQLLSAHEIPKDLHTEIEIDETDDGDADDVCHPENLNMKLNPKSKLLKIKNTQNEKRLYICDTCDRSFGSAAGLKRHGILKHSTTKKLKKLNKKKKTFSCSVCSYKCTQQLHLTRHIRTHSGDDPFSCNTCSYKCASKTLLIQHFRTHTVKYFSCDICNLKCAEISHLTLHMRTHTGEKPFCCDICNRRYTQKSSLELHKRIHAVEQPFCCDICDRRYTQKSSLTLHKRTHTGENPFSCDICNYKCTYQSNLTLHKRTHTGEKPFSCDICGFKCTGKSNLTRHKRTHTGENPFSCDICEYKCKQKQQLTRHIRTHTGQKPFSCDICRHKCAQKSTLIQHIRTHTGEKPFSCDICSYKCAQKSSLRRHIIRNHTRAKPFS